MFYKDAPCSSRAVRGSKCMGRCHPFLGVLQLRKYYYGMVNKFVR